MKDVLGAVEVPASNEKQCGWAAHLTLEGAQQLACDFLAKRSEWHLVFSHNE